MISTVQPKNNARARTSFCVRKPGNFLRQIADACACVLRTARSSLRLESFNSKNFFAVRLSKRKNFFASQRFNRAGESFPNGRGSRVAGFKSRVAGFKKVAGFQKSRVVKRLYYMNITKNKIYTL